MTDAEKVTMLKVDLGITTNAYDERLENYLQTARKMIAREGVVLTQDAEETVDDINLNIIYAAWLWRKRDTGEGMPRMLRWELNNRVFDLKQD